MKIVKWVNSLDANEKKLLYMCNSRPVFKPGALYSDATKDYRMPPECDPWDTVRLRLRTGKFNIDNAYVYVDNEEYAMERVDKDECFDYYEASIEVGENPVSYYFKVEAARGVVYYYNQIGAAKELNPYYNFRIYPGHKVPKWVYGAVMYQIFVDRLCSGDSSNDVLDDEYSYIGGHVTHVKWRD